jgi:hypothetical protein
MLPITLTILCALFLGVRCGFPLKRNTNSLFVQARLKKNHTLTTNPPPQTPIYNTYDKTTHCDDLSK